MARDDEPGGGSGGDDDGGFPASSCLGGLSETARRALRAVLRTETAGAGSILLREGQPNDRLGFLAEGALRLTRSYPGHPDEEVVRLQAPATFGETSFFRGRPSLVTARAETAVRYFALDREVYEAMRRDDPIAAEALARAMLCLLAERFDLLDRRVSDFLAEGGNGARKASEWTAFRSRLFREGGP
jgi:CRP-like cAMP-binding protein